MSVTPTRTVEVVLPPCRTDLDDFFRLSGVLTWKTLNHTPFLAFVAGDSSVAVRLVSSAKALLELPDQTPVMAQWRGQWSSDFFRMTVADVRAALAARGDR